MLSIAMLAVGVVLVMLGLWKRGQRWGQALLFFGLGVIVTVAVLSVPWIGEHFVWGEKF